MKKKAHYNYSHEEEAEGGKYSHQMGKKMPHKAKKDGKKHHKKKK
jgi:hypothetical protein